MTQAYDIDGCFDIVNSELVINSCDEIGYECTSLISAFIDLLLCLVMVISQLASLILEFIHRF